MNPHASESTGATLVDGAGTGGAGRAMLEGAWRFAVVSLGGFAVWAFAGKWFYANVGEGGLYAATAAVFVGLAGLLLHPLVEGPRPVARLYGVFVPAFLAYAVVWCAFWFLLRFGAGEWLGAFVGCLAFAAVCGWRLGNWRPVWLAGAILFVTHSAGYFAGGWLMHFLAGPKGAELFGGLTSDQVGVIARLSWGLLYGLGFGAGIGFTFFALRRSGAKAVRR